MPKLTIDDQEITVPEGMTVLQAAEMLGTEIPVFCYHPKLSIAGNCRMCLVEMEGKPKPIASCAMPVSEGMVIRTTTEPVKEARNHVLELLLINHPLDCPICDQGGECDLQDISVAYGCGKSRYTLNKRAVPDKDFGPLIETAMNRCIQCTRCIRFSAEIAGIPELGTTGRGENLEITTCLEKTITSELSGNLIDVCPVGALMSKPYTYRGRPWELSHTPSFDIFDAVGSSIRIDTKGNEVMRILPRRNDAVNEEWISDKVRFSYDGLKSQRLDQPYIRNQQGQLVPTTWDKAFGVIAHHLHGVPGHQIAAVAGDLMDAEAMIVLKDLMTALKSPHIDCRQDGAKVASTPRCGYLFNTTIAGIEKADFCLLIGTNPRYEAPLINARLRKAYLAHDLPIAHLGIPCDLGYPMASLGDDPHILEEILKDRHPISTLLKKASHPMLIVGKDLLTRDDGGILLEIVRQIADKYGFIHHTPPEDHWNGFNVLHTAASRVGGLDLGFTPGPKGYDVPGILKAASGNKLKAVYLLGADELDMSAFKSTFVIYQGHHGDQGASHADVILPGAAYTEKAGTYVNTEGRVQQSLRAVFPPGQAQEDWKILRALAEHLRVELPYSTLEGVRRRLIEVNSLFEETDVVQRAPWLPFGQEGKPLKKGFESKNGSFYMTDPISRHSLIMAQCRQTHEQKGES